MTVRTFSRSFRHGLEVQHPPVLFIDCFLSLSFSPHFLLLFSLGMWLDDAVCFAATHNIA